jgi:methionyl-tRNA formyltransferase
MPLRLVMMGTGTFAVPTFQALLDSPHDVVGLFTQPDRVGRGHHHHPHPMKELAVARQVPVYQPDNVNLPESLEPLRALRADLAVVAAYGQILSTELLATPRLGAINLHASLLPKYRGAAPVQYAVWKGEQETGITLFQIEPKLDAGPVLGVVRTPIGPEETSGTLEDRLAELAVPLTLKVLDDLAAGRVVPLPQNPGEVTRARKLKKTDGDIPWSKRADEIDWHIRAMQPWPMPYTWWHAAGHPPVRLQILAISKTAGGGTTEPESSRAPGTIVRVDENSVLIQTGDGQVALKSVRPDGKRAMEIGEFLRGHRMKAGDRLGPES